MAENRFLKYGQQPQQVAPADPRLPGQVAGQAIDNRKTTAETNRLVQITPADIQKAIAEASKATAEAEAARVKAETDRLAREETNKAKQGNIAKLESLITSLDSLQQDASDNGGWFELGYTGSLLRNRPGTAAYDLNSAITGIQGGQFIEALRDLKSQSQTGSTGAGGLTEAEGERIVSSTGNLDPNQSLESFNDQLTKAREAALLAYRRLGGSNPQIDPEAAQTDKTPPLVSGGQQPDRFTGSTNGFREEIDPVLKGVSGRLGKMVSSGASDGQIRDFLLKNGVHPDATNIGSVLQYRRSPEFKTWQRANPGKAYPIGSEFYTNKIPLNTAQKIGNYAAQSAPGAYFINAAQGATAGHLDDLSSALGGNGEAVNTGVQYSRSASPTASFLGDMSGQALAQAMIPGSAALRARRFGQLGEDLLYGAAAGHGEGDTFGGALANAGGGILGRRVGDVASLGLRGIRNPSQSLSYLNNAEVPLTLGQIGRGSNTTVGSAIGGLEDRAAGFPIFDAIINTARQRGDVGFNRAAFREMGGSGATGSAGVSEGQGLVGNAYSFLDNTTMPIDVPFANQQARIRSMLPGLPSFGPEIGKSLNKIDTATLSQPPILTGRDWQSALRSTKRNRSSIRGKEFSDDAVDVLDAVETNLLDLASRQGPPGTAVNLSDANRLNMNFRTITSALDNGPAQARGELFSPNRLDTAARDTGRRFGSQVNSMAGQRPFYNLTQAGMDVMPNLTPDSGTAGRAIFYSALPGVLGGGIGASVGATNDGGAADGAQSGATIGAGATLLPTLALAALYSKGGQKGIQKTLLGPRPQALIDLDSAIQNNRAFKKLVKDRNVNIGGLLGSSLIRDAYLLPEL